MNAQLNGMTLQAKIPRRSRGWFAVIVAAVVAAGMASALLLTRSGTSGGPVPIQAPVMVAPAASIPASGTVSAGSIGNQGAATPRRLDDRYFGEPISPVPQATAHSMGSGQGDGESTGTSRQGDCVVYQPRC
jgi:hypothetical protein